MINNPTDRALQPLMDEYHPSGLHWDQPELDAGLYDFSRINNIFSGSDKSHVKSWVWNNGPESGFSHFRNYNLVLKVTDPANSRLPFPIAI